jgi:hypothetical protein
MYSCMFLTSRNFVQPESASTILSGSSERTCTARMIGLHSKWHLRTYLYSQDDLGLHSKWQLRTYLCSQDGLHGPHNEWQLKISKCTCTARMASTARGSSERTCTARVASTASGSPERTCTAKIASGAPENCKSKLCKVH